MGNDITIHHLPEFVSDELKRRARGEGKSFQEYMLGVLADIAANPDAEVLQRKLEGIACTPSPADRLRDAQAFVESSGARVSAEEIVGMLRDDRER